MGGISKMIDDKLAAAVPISQQSVAGVSQGPAPEVTTVDTSQGDEVNNRLRPRLKIDKDTNEISGTKSINEFSVDEIGVRGRNKRDYLHGIIKSFDAGVCDREKLRKAMSEETKGKIRALENTKVNQTAVSSQEKKRCTSIIWAQQGSQNVQDFIYIEKAKNDGIQAVLAEWDFLADQEDSPSKEEENANEDKESGDEEGDSEEDDQDEQENEKYVVIMSFLCRFGIGNPAHEEEEEQEEDDDLPRPTRNTRGRSGSSQDGGSSKGKKKRKVPDSQFAQDPYHSYEEEEPPRNETKKKAANDTRRSATTTRTRKAAKSPVIKKTYKKRRTGR
ncbi:hypothetical protein R1sor_012842 [Riccia sorocarpa]|uniref:Uncharacterized protein n=1 Tax=Riccia sorocarpa TaxID=122646 RepID=A0ABD3I5J3_9MARC